MSDTLSPLAENLKGYVRTVGMVALLAALSEVAHAEVDRVLEEERNRVQAGRLATVGKDLRAMSKVLNGEL